MSLPEEDLAYLRDRGLDYEVTVEANMTCLVFPGWQLPIGYNRETTDLLVRLSGGYPDVAPDMWWFEPAVKGVNDETIQNTEVTEIHLGRTWQRWSRHFSAGQWQSGMDGLQTFLALIARELRSNTPGAAT